MFILGIFSTNFGELLSGAMESYCGLHVAETSHVRFGSLLNLDIAIEQVGWACSRQFRKKTPVLNLKKLLTPPSQTRTVNNANGIIGFSCDQYIQSFSGVKSISQRTRVQVSQLRSIQTGLRRWRDLSPRPRARVCVCPRVKQMLIMHFTHAYTYCTCHTIMSTHVGKWWRANIYSIHLYTHSLKIVLFVTCEATTYMTC